MPYYKRNDYKSPSTALNGIIQWLERYMVNKLGYSDLLYNDKLEAMYLLIMKYGAEFKPAVGLQGKNQTKADRIAKNIQANKMFSHFTKWVKNQANTLTHQQH